MSIQRNQLRENSMRTSVLLFRETSTLFPRWHNTDTLTWSTTETLLSRHQMLERPKPGTSIKRHWPSRLDWTTNHGTSRPQVRPKTCKYGAPTQIGGKSSSMTKRKRHLPTWLIRRYLMFQDQRMKKDKLLLSQVAMVKSTSNGVYFTLTLSSNRPRDYTLNLDSIAADHSTLSQDSQWTESWNLLVPTISPLEDGERTLLLKLGCTTAPTRPSEATTGKTMLSKSNPMEDQQTLDAHPQSTQDGGNCSDTKTT